MTLALGDIRYLIMDMDGVLYRGNEALPGAADFLTWLDDARHQVPDAHQQLGAHARRLVREDGQAGHARAARTAS